MKRINFYMGTLVISCAMIITFVLASSAYAVSDAHKYRSNLGYQQSNPKLAQPGVVESLTGPNKDAPRDIALDYIKLICPAQGLRSEDVVDMKVTSEYVTKDTGVSHLYYTQQVEGLEVYGANININIAKDGSVSSMGNSFMPNVSNLIGPTTTPKLSAIEAVELAAKHLELGSVKPLEILQNIGGPAKEVVISDGGISQEDIPAKLVFQPVSKENCRLAWNIEIYVQNSNHFWNLNVDAQNGKVLSQVDLVVSEQYEVFAIPKEYPDNGPRTIEVNPFDPTASEFGWHDTNGAAGPEFTITRGNNVHAYADRDANNSPDAGSEPDGGGGLDFTGAVVPLNLANEPNTYTQAAVANLFYWNNIIHDVLYVHGFDEAAGNFQVNNYGNGGLGGDDVRAEAQDGGGMNNANFLTLSDGTRPRMQMFEWDQTTPRRDGDFSNGIIIHEYGHGISNRLTGGPANVNCLRNSEQMGEGWSDFFGLVLTANSSDTATTLRGLGTYVLGQPTNGRGIRPAQYTTDMTVNGFTYGNIGSQRIPHGVGFVWATMLWEMYWNLVATHGFNSDIYGDWTTGGNNLALRLVIDGLKLQPCSPGFVDGRDAILEADMNLTGGQNQCDIWKAFAKRGLGLSASQGNSNSTTDGTEAFDLHASCDEEISHKYEYAAKFVCGFQTDKWDMRLARGNYATAINIHNPNKDTVKFRKKLALTFPAKEQRPGKIIPIGVDKLKYDEALEVDCEEIEKALREAGITTRYSKGFVVIQSEKSLDVTAVYTTAALDKQGNVTDHSSIDVEEISERIITEDNDQ